MIKCAHCGKAMRRAKSWDNLFPWLKGKAYRCRNRGCGMGVEWTGEAEGVVERARGIIKGGSK